MSRLHIGIFLLIFLLLAGIGVAWLMPRFHMPISQKFFRAAELCAQGQGGEAIEQFHEAQTLWEKYRTFTASVCDHQPQHDIDALIAEAVYWGSTEVWDEFGACCSRLALMTKELSKLHGLNLSQLL